MPKPECRRSFAVTSHRFGLGFASRSLELGPKTGHRRPILRNLTCFEVR